MSVICWRADEIFFSMMSLTLSTWLASLDVAVWTWWRNASTVCAQTSAQLTQVKAFSLSQSDCFTNVHAVPRQGAESRLEADQRLINVRLEQILDLRRYWLDHAVKLRQNQLQVVFVALEPSFLQQDGLNWVRQRNPLTLHPPPFGDQLQNSEIEAQKPIRCGLITRWSELSI